VTRHRRAGADEPARDVRDARRRFGAAVVQAVALSLFLTGGVTMLVATVPSRDPNAAWFDALPRLNLADALTLVTVFLVVFGLGVVRGPGRLPSGGTADTSAAMSEQQLREVAIVAGWAGTTIALWAAIDALAGWQADDLTAGGSAGSLLAALSAGALMASLAALVPARYPPAIQALVDAGRRANEATIVQQLRSWGISDADVAAVGGHRWPRFARLVLPVLAQTLAPSALVLGYLALRDPISALDAAGFGLLSFACAAVGAAAVIAPFAFFRATPRAPIVGTASVIYPVLYVLLSAGVVVARWGQPITLILWCTPLAAIALRLGISLVARRWSPFVASGVWSLVDRRWWVAAYLEASQPARVTAAADAAADDGREQRGYM